MASAVIITLRFILLLYLFEAAHNVKALKCGRPSVPPHTIINTENGTAYFKCNNTDSNETKLILVGNQAISCIGEQLQKRILPPSPFCVRDLFKQAPKRIDSTNRMVAQLTRPAPTSSNKLYVIILNETRLSVEIKGSNGQDFGLCIYDTMLSSRFSDDHTTRSFYLCTVPLDSSLELDLYIDGGFKSAYNLKAIVFWASITNECGIPPRFPNCKNQPLVLGGTGPRLITARAFNNSYTLYVNNKPRAMEIIACNSLLGIWSWQDNTIFECKIKPTARALDAPIFIGKRSSQEHKNSEHDNENNTELPLPPPPPTTTLAPVVAIYVNDEKIEGAVLDRILGHNKNKEEPLLITPNQIDGLQHKVDIFQKYSNLSSVILRAINTSWETTTNSDATNIWWSDPTLIYSIVSVGCTAILTLILRLCCCCCPDQCRKATRARLEIMPDTNDIELKKLSCIVGGNHVAYPSKPTNKKKEYIEVHNLQKAAAYYQPQTQIGRHSASVLTV